MSASLLFSLAVVVGAPAPRVSAKAEPGLVGEWVAEQVLVGGRDATPDKAGPWFAFRPDGRLAITDTPQAPAVERYSVDATANPARVDLFPAPGSNGPTLLGAFRVDGDILTLVLALSDSESARPTRLESGKGSNTVLVVLRRVKK